MAEELLVHLKVARARAGLTQEELAARIGVTRKTINTIERGHFIPSTLLALKLAAALGTRVEELFSLDEAGRSNIQPPP